MIGFIVVMGVASISWLVTCAVRDRPAEDAIPGVLWLGITLGAAYGHFVGAYLP